MESIVKVNFMQEGGCLTMFQIKQILRLAIPSIATFSSMTFTGLLVLMIVGRLGAAAIAVVGIANILMNNMWALFSGIQFYEFDTEYWVLTIRNTRPVIGFIG
jgi:Na+-driven multidrug efflux pump